MAMADDRLVRIFVETGIDSEDNGAATPMATFMAIAEVADAEVTRGWFYGSDCLTVRSCDAGALVDLLREQRMLFRHGGSPHDWQNVTEGSMYAQRLEHARLRTMAVCTPGKVVHREAV